MTRAAAEASKKPLGLFELVAIALGGMIGGGIFAVLGIAVEGVGNAAAVAIALGGGVALLAAYPYAKLTALYEDEGATYSFFKRTFPAARTATVIVGWLVVFGYIATLALYAFTFASYVIGLLAAAPPAWLRPAIGIGVIAAFAVLNVISVRLVGLVEDVMVYVKLAALLLIAVVLFASGAAEQAWPVFEEHSSLGGIATIAALTFVAFEGFQLAIHAYGEADAPRTNVPRAIYISVAIATVVYVMLAEGALWAIPQAQIIRDKEFALAAGASSVLGNAGLSIVVAGALLATSSAISGTLFGASRLIAVIAADQNFPSPLGLRNAARIPVRAIVAMTAGAAALLLSGGLNTILEFGSLTFIVVSLLMAVCNWRVRAQTGANRVVSLLSIAGLALAGVLIVHHEATDAPARLAATLGTFGGIAVLATIYSRVVRR